MSTILCGKRSFFEELDSVAQSPAYASPPAYKKFRCSLSTSPVRLTYSPPVHTGSIDHLKALFPDMDIQVLEKVFEESGCDLDLAIKSLHKLCLEHTKGNPDFTKEENITMENSISSHLGGATTHGGSAVPLQEPQVQKNIPVNGAEWVDIFVKEMISATSMDDARSRAATLLETLERTISSHASAKAAESFCKENAMLKEQIDVLLRDNIILKRAVAIQHERQKENDERAQEVEQLKQLVAQYKEQLRTLEVNNYALSMHLRQARQSNSISGRFHPDVF